MKEVQSIDIDYYDSVEQNIELAVALSHYDRNYITKDVSAYDEETAPGVAFAFDIDASQSKALFWVSYSTSNSSVSSRVDELAKEFDEYIKAVQVSHVAMQPVFERLEPIGRKWVESVFAESPEMVFSDSSVLMQDLFTQEQWSERCSLLSRDFGRPSRVQFLHAQYYEDFEGSPDYVSLMYRASFAGSGELRFQIRMFRQEEDWKFGGMIHAPEESWK